MTNPKHSHDYDAREMSYALCACRSNRDALCPRCEPVDYVPTHCLAPSAIQCMECHDTADGMRDWCAEFDVLPSHAMCCLLDPDALS